MDLHLKAVEAQIEHGTIPELRSIRELFQEAYQRHLNELHPDVWVREVNHVYDLLIKRTVQLAEQELQGQGMGLPPVSYVFVLFGSGGRQEQTLWSDQDNGLIYEDSNKQSNDEGKEDAVRAYFNQLAQTIESLLVQLGFPPCDGDVIASNPLWCKPLSSWKKSMDQWFEAADWEHVRYLLIAEDARAIHGNNRLLLEWKAYFRECVNKEPDMIEHMLRNTLKHKVVLGIFGHFIKEQYGKDAGGIDVKYGVYIPFVNSIRLLSVLYEVESETSTLRRLEKLNAVQCFSIEESEQIQEAFTHLLQYRAMSPYYVEDNCYVSNGIVKAQQFNEKQRNELKQALKIGRWLQKQVRHKVTEFKKLRGDKNG
jgi:CBS domain-containing protein